MANKQDTASLPDVKIGTPYTKIDLATILGLLFAVGLIIAAIILGLVERDIGTLDQLADVFSLDDGGTAEARGDLSDGFEFGAGDQLTNGFGDRQ